MPVNKIPAAAWTGRSDPEDGPSALRFHHLMVEQAERALIGFACDAGVIRNKGRLGSKEGPTALRKALANLAAPVNANGFCDLGDIEVTGDDLEAGQKALSEEISTALRHHERIIVLGGGHETAFGSYCGVRSANPDAKIGIINLDAHLDLRLVGKGGPSSGTPFTQIRDLDPDNFDYLCVGIASEANTAALIQRANDWGVHMIEDHALIDNHEAADEAIEAIINRSDLIYLTVCLDVLPHYQAPGVSAPATRGLSLSIVEHLIGQIVTRCSALGRDIPLADIVELSPPHDMNGTTAKTAALLARQLLIS